MTEHTQLSLSPNMVITKDEKTSYIIQVVMQTTNSSTTALCRKMYAPEKPQYVLKFIFNKPNRNSRKEIDILREIDHPNIIKVHDSFLYGEYNVLVTVFYEGGTLLNYIRSSHYNYKTTLVFAKQCLLALKYCHSKGIIHNDIKLQNFFFVIYPSPHVVLADFGFAQKIQDGEAFLNRSGTIGYLSPEKINNLPHDASTDIWSLGVTFFQIFTKFSPFRNEDDIKTGKFKRPRAWMALNSEVQHLIESMLKVNLRDRITAENALELPLFTPVTDKSEMKSNSDIMEALLMATQSTTDSLYI